MLEKQVNWYVKVNVVAERRKKFINSVSGGKFDYGKKSHIECCAAKVSYWTTLSSKNKTFAKHVEGA